MTAAIGGGEAIEGFAAKHGTKGGAKVINGGSPRFASRQKSVSPTAAKHTAKQHVAKHSSSEVAKAHQVAKNDLKMPKASSANKFINHAGSVTKYRQLLVAEIAIGGIIILTEPSSVSSPTDFAESAEQLVAFLLVFFILALMTSAGPGAARVSASLGGVILIGLMLRPKNVTFFNNLIPPGFRGKGTSTSVASTPTADTSADVLPLPSGTRSNPIGQSGGVYNA